MGDRKLLSKLRKEIGYTEEDNPFGDRNLFQPFVWDEKLRKEREEKGSSEGSRKSKKKKSRKSKKKKKKSKSKKKRSKKHGGSSDSSDSSSDSSSDDSSDDEDEPSSSSSSASHSLEMLREIKELRQRRAQREQEEEDMIKFREEEYRMREAAQYGEFLEKEEEFHADAFWRRSRLRIRNRRRRAVDRLTRNWIILWDLQDKQRESEQGFASSSSRGSEADIASFRVEDRPPALTLRLPDPSHRHHHHTSSETLLEDVEEAVHACEVSGKGEEVLGFWRGVLALLRLPSSSSVQDRAMEERVGQQVALMLGNKSLEGMKRVLVRIEERVEEEKAKADRSEAAFWERVVQKANEQYLTKMLDTAHASIIERIIDLRGREPVHGGNISSEEEEEEHGRSVAAGHESSHHRHHHKVEEAKDVEMSASDEVDIDRLSSSSSSSSRHGHHHQGPLRYDKNTVRKPLYFNRVKTGYQWSKYNRAHYDAENPPPRIVQGYRFNIFYPDLVDPTMTPTFRLENDPDGSEDLCIIRFSAGAPYEDIAFKIVNREWDKHRKSGYRCVFNRGVLQLYFNLKHRVYKR